MVPSATLMIRSLCSLLACMAILATQSEAQTIALRGGMIYTAPEVPPITAGTVVVRGGRSPQLEAPVTFRFPVMVR
jgi:hypothetical protein